MVRVVTLKINILHGDHSYPTIMAVASAGWLFNSFRSTYRYSGVQVYPVIYMQTRDYAARKGTREKLRKRVVKAIAEKAKWVAKLQRAKLKKETKKDLRICTSDRKSLSPDNVWLQKYHREKIYDFEEAIQCHRETHHPSMYNCPDSPITAVIELNLQGEKATRIVNLHTRIVDIPHVFDQGADRKILAFSKDASIQAVARKAGAQFTGGRELIKDIQNGEFSIKEYDYFVAHQDILSDLVFIRGLIQKKFPSIKTGTLGIDMEQMVRRLYRGIEYTAKADSKQKTYGIISAAFGTLNMDTKQLEENFNALIDDIEKNRPKRAGDFILRACFISPPSTEKLRIDIDKHIRRATPPPEAEEEEEDLSAVVIPSH